MRETMRRCIFCQKSLTANNRAKEHVFRHSWLRSLGHKKTGISLDKSSKYGYLKTHELAADQLQAGEVCANCNNGWMNYLDHRVERIILDLARTPGAGLDLSKQNSRVLARWLLKTACSFVHTDSHERRHIPRSILSNVRRDGYLPPGFVAFAARSILPEKGVGIAHLDIWDEEQIGTIGKLPQSCRLKFGIQYDSVILGCSYVNCKTPVFTGISGFHVPFVQSQAKFILTPPPPGTIGSWITAPDFVDKNILNLFLLLVSVKPSA